MGALAPVYAREIGDPIEAVFESSGPFGLSWSLRAVLRRGDTAPATEHLAQETGFRPAFA